ncbi:MAG: PorT family protein [Bacteroidetes bacterium]|nr:MAG: PorT family protein [Bacteroidota bacterium]
MIIRIFSCVILLLINPSISFSQDFHAGIRAGMSASQVSGDRLSGFDKAGIVFGGFVGRNFSEKISGQMEISFIQKGSRSSVNKEDNSYYRMRLHYIQVPVLFQYKVGKKIDLEVGPSAGVLVLSEENDQLGLINNTPPFEDMDVSFNAGGSYQIGEHWTFNARYSASILPVRKFQGSYNFNFFDRGQYNELIELAFLYRF